MKVKVTNGFTGLSHGLTFTNGESEEFDDKELASRLVRKGYVLVDEKKPTEKEKLMEECTTLGIDTTGLTTIEKLKAAIKEFKGAQ